MTQYRRECMEALEMQMSWLRWWEGTGGDGARRTLLRDNDPEQVKADVVSRIPAASEVDGRIIQRWQHDAECAIYERPLRFGEVTYVSDEFCDIVGHIVDGMPDEVAFSIDMLPSRCGLIVFDRDMPIPDPPAMKDLLAKMPPHLQHAHFRAIGWHCITDSFPDKYSPRHGVRDTGTGVHVSFVCYRAQGDPYTDGFWPWSFYGLQNGELVGDAVRDYERVDGRGFRMGADADEREKPVYAEEDLRLHEIRYTYAVLAFMRQKLVTAYQMPLERSTRRRVEKAKLQREHVKVIMFRRYATDPERGHDRSTGNGHRNFSCHFPVRGHPRWQPCGPGKTQRRLIWIEPYVKGDLTKPFRGGDDMRRVFSVER